MARNAGLSLGDRRRTLGIRVRRFLRQGAGAAAAIARTGARYLGHDPSDRSRTPPTLRAAAETAIDLACHARRVGVHNGPNLMVGQDVARTNDHPARLPLGIDGCTIITLYEIMQTPFVCKRKRVFRSSLNAMDLMFACLSGCHPQPLAVVFGHAHGRSPAWQSSVPTIAPRVPATFSRRRGLRRLPGEGSLERRVCLPPLSGGGRAVPLRKSSWRLALPQVPP